MFLCRASGHSGNFYINSRYWSNEMFEVVQNQIGLKGADRYDALFGELTDFIDLKSGGVDEKALRLMLATLYIHHFTKEPPISLWMRGCPAWMCAALETVCDRQVRGHSAGFLAVNARATTKPAVFFSRYAEQMFFNINIARRALDVMVALTQGHMEWSPLNRKLDQIGTEVTSPFVWDGRVTFLCGAGARMNEYEHKIYRRAWPVAENTFVEVSYDLIKAPEGRVIDLIGEAMEAAPTMGRLILNVLDRGFRESHKARKPEGLFDSVLWLTRVVAAFRAPGFDPVALGVRAVRLAMAHASMMGKEEADSEDVTLARKVILDAIPEASRKIAAALPLDGYFTHHQISRVAKVRPKESEQALDTLFQNDCVFRTYARGEGEMYTVSPEMQQALLIGL